MAMLEAMSEIGPRLGLDLHVAHLDHGWRRSRASQLVGARCRSLGLPLSIGQLPPGWAASEGKARRERRSFLAGVARAIEAQAVILAHHATDQAETVLAHLLQGSGARGLAGMTEWAEALWLRPLLDVPGVTIRQWADQRGLVYEDDPTNRDEAHLRNWIRHQLLVRMATRQPRVVDALIRSARLADQDEEALQAEADAYLRWSEPNSGGVMLAAMPAAPQAVRARVAYQLLVRLGRRPTEGQVLALAEALSRGGGGGRGLWVARLGPRLWVGPSALASALPRQVVPRPGETVCFPAPVPAGLIEMELRPLAGPLWLRGWLAGDRMASGGGLKSLWDGAQIPRPLRPRVPLVVGEDGVVAVLGVRGPWQGTGGWIFSASRGTLEDPRTGGALLGSERPIVIN